MTYELHPLCTFFPRLEGAEFAALREDIRINGQRQPIVLHEGMVLDGGNRYRACIEAGIEPSFVEFAGGDAVAFVLSANLHRRHLSAGQHAAIVASVTNWATAHRHGGDRKSDQAVTLPLDSVADRMAVSGASDKTQRVADKVAKADPELAKAVGQGKTTLAKAAVQIGEAPRKPAKPAPATKTAAQIEAEQAAEDAHGDFDPIAELESAQAEIAELRAQIKAAEADDQKAEALKWRRLYETAQRTASEKQDAAHRYQAELQRASDRLTRIGKLFGERDPAKIPALVEAFYRQHARAVA